MTEEDTRYEPPGTTFMTPEEISAYPENQEKLETRAARAAMRDRLAGAGQWSANQVIGRRYSIGCVALEITQRCNLDCTLCYLSEHSQAVKDLPLPGVLRRIETISDLYGPGTNMQITGGDPTLRQRDELVEIVAAVRRKGMRPALFTNGIKASRELLSALAAAGLNDVAFHVDLTQERKGYASEAALNAIRLEYMERARGLPLAVQFNTTVYGGNIDEIPDLIRFFASHADRLSLVSFQLHADTGRGVERGRDRRITPDGMSTLIEEVAERKLGFDLMQPGHKRCNRYAAALISNGEMAPVAADRDFVAEALSVFETIDLDRRDPGRAGRQLVGWLLRHPRYLPRAIGWGVGRLWDLRRGLLRGARRGCVRVDKLAFFIHNFMDACALERDRIDACVFHTVTRDGAVSMCLHNAKRDAFILKPVQLEGRTWSPASGTFETGATQASKLPELTRKTARGLVKQRLNRQQSASVEAKS